MPKHKENNTEKYCLHPGGVYIHYDTSCESLPAWQFINAIKSIKKIIDDINNKLLDGELEYEVFIRPPQKGSFLIDIGVFMGGLLALAKALETDLGKAFVEGLTGQKPEYWVKKGGESANKYIYIFFDIIKGFLEKPNERLKKIGVSITKFKKSFKAKNRIYEDCLKNPDIKRGRV